MKFFLLAVAIAAGISTTTFADSKGVSTNISGFDGTKEVTLKPYGSSSCKSFTQTCISVGALWKSDLADLVGLNLFALNDLVIMSELLINIDGEIIKATRVIDAGGINTVGNYKESHQRFAIKRDDLDKILNAKKVWFKVNRTDGSYVETYLIDDGKDTLAFKALQRFANNIK